MWLALGAVLKKQNGDLERLRKGGKKSTLSSKEKLRTG